MVRGLARFRGTEQNWRAWLFTTARRRVIDQARQLMRRPATSLEALPELTLAELPGLRSPDAADLALENLATRAAIAVIACLPPAASGGGHAPGGGQAWTTEGVARLLGRSPGAIRIAAHRGLHRLAGLLGRGRCNAMTEPGVSDSDMPTFPWQTRPEARSLDALLAGTCRTRRSPR